MISGAFMICMGIAALLAGAGAALVGLGTRLARKPCPHKWTEKATIEVRSPGYEYPLFHDYVLKCEHCGDIQKRRV